MPAESRGKVIEAIEEAEAWLVELRRRMHEHAPGDFLIGSAFPKARMVKIAADNKLYFELARRSRDRNVTMNYLVLETLKEAGFPVDLASVQKEPRVKAGEGA